MLEEYAKILAASLATLEEHASHHYRPKAQPRACDKKKCKSCKFYGKPLSKYGKPTCGANHYCYEPMQVACDRYKKRK